MNHLDLPPRNAKREAWVIAARRYGIVSEGKTRDEIIAAVEEALPLFTAPVPPPPDEEPPRRKPYFSI